MLCTLLLILLKSLIYINRYNKQRWLSVVFNGYKTATLFSKKNSKS